MTEFTTWRSLVDGEEIDVIADSDVFQDPILQWWAGEGINVDDGEKTDDWDDAIEGVTATDVGFPTYREDQAGSEAVEYDGSDDAHDFDFNEFPSGTDSVSVGVLFYVPTSNSIGSIVSWGDTSVGGSGFELRVRDDPNKVEFNNNTDGFDAIGAEIDLNEWYTAVCTFDGNEAELYLNGSSEGTEDGGGPSADDQDRAIGYNRSRDDWYYEGFVAETLWSDADESANVQEYHDSRMDLVE